MSTSIETKKKNNAAATAEYERLFGTGVDLFKNYYNVLGIRNILKTIGVRTSLDYDWFKAVTEFITDTEVAELYDSILSPRKRRAMDGKMNYRNPPELTDDLCYRFTTYINVEVMTRMFEQEIMYTELWNYMLENATPARIKRNGSTPFFQASA